MNTQEILVTFPAVPEGLLEESVYINQSQIGYIKEMAKILKLEEGLDIVIGEPSPCVDPKPFHKKSWNY